jgi:2-iminobutanoate/2-iminopropanoate deaminase
MDKKTHTIEGFPRVGPYSHVVEAGDLLFLSGMIPVDPGRGLSIKDDVPAATDLILTNVRTALAAVGSDLDKVVKATVFLRDMADFAAMNEVYKTFFPENPPARSCVAVREIPGGFPIEIEVVAIK